jgi:hypothetical protein
LRDGRSSGPASASENPYQDWSCDQLGQEVVRADAGLAEGDEKAIERAMTAKGCIQPLAVETE